MVMDKFDGKTINILDSAFLPSAQLRKLDQKGIEYWKYFPKGLQVSILVSEAQMQDKVEILERKLEQSRAIFIGVQFERQWELLEIQHRKFTKAK